MCLTDWRLPRALSASVKNANVMQYKSRRMCSSFLSWVDTWYLMWNAREIKTESGDTNERDFCHARTPCFIQRKWSICIPQSSQCFTQKCKLSTYDDLYLNEKCASVVLQHLANGFKNFMWPIWFPKNVNFSFSIVAHIAHATGFSSFEIRDEVAA